MRFYTSNPVFNAFFWKKEVSKNKMTLNGVLFKMFFSLLLVSISFSYVWRLVYKGESVKWYIYIGLFSALFFTVLTSYKHKWAFFTVPIYAISKGFFLGSFSAYTNQHFEGLPQKAVIIVIITFFVMLFLYKLKIVVVTKKFRSILYSTMATIFTIYIIAFILRLFDIPFNLVYGTSWFSILFTLIASVAASFSLILDFYYLDKQLYKAPKYKEWVAVWGFLVTLIWMYVEILRLFKKLAIRF